MRVLQGGQSMKEKTIRGLSHMVGCLMRDFFALEVFGFVIGHSCRYSHDFGAGRTLSIVLALQKSLAPALLRLCSLTQIGQLKVVQLFYN